MAIRTVPLRMTALVHAAVLVAGIAGTGIAQAAEHSRTLPKRGISPRQILVWPQPTEGLGRKLTRACRPPYRWGRLPRQHDPDTTGWALQTEFDPVGVMRAPNKSSVATAPTTPGHDLHAVAMEAQNPIGILTQVIIRNNINFGIGSFDRTQNVLNVQAIVPIPLSDKVKIVTRSIIRMVGQPHTSMEAGTTLALGDFIPTAFLCRRKPRQFDWGVGASMILPTATSNRLGTGKWSGGPSIVMIKRSGHFVVGLMASNYWSFAGDSSRPDVRTLVAEPFANYNFPKHKGWFINSAPIVSANWTAPTGERWIVPLGMGVGRAMRIGRQHLVLQAEAYYNAIRPTVAAAWQLRLSLKLLLARRPK